jgi:Sap, sulfolipid-1-addressing protein
VGSEPVQIFLLSLTAMFNPTLLAAVTLMLLLPKPKALLFGYLLGAYTTSITVGLVIVIALPESSAEKTSKHQISPAEDLVVALLLLAVAWILHTGRDEPFQQRRQTRKEAKVKAKQEAGKPTESLPLRMLGKGDPRVTYVVGALLSFPGVSYLAALDRIHGLKLPTAPTVLIVVAFCVVQQMFLELPLLSYVSAPDTTKDRVTRFRAWMSRSGRRAAVTGSFVLGVLLVIRGVLTLL